MASGGTGRRPQPEGPVDVRPAPVLVHYRDGGSQVVAGAGVHVAGLETHDGGTGRPLRQRGGQRLDLDGAIGVGGDRFEDTGAEAQEAERAVDGGVSFAGGDHPDRRRANEAVLLDVPASTGEHLVAGGGQADRVGPLGSGDEAGGDAGGKAEQIREPSAGDLLDDGGRGRRQIVVGRLVPGRDEQLGGGGGGEGATDDEPEVAGTGGGNDRRLYTRDQLVDDARGRRWVLGHGASDGSPHVVEIDRRKDGRFVGGGAVLGHVGGRRASSGPRSSGTQ